MTAVRPDAFHIAGYAGGFDVEIPEGLSSDWNFLHWLVSNHNGSAVGVKFEAENNLAVNLLLPLIPWILIFGLLWLFVARPLKANRATARRPMPVVIVNPEAMQ